MPYQEALFATHHGSCDILGLDYEETCQLSDSERTNRIKQAYRDNILRYHPDKSGPSTHEDAIQINQAYTFLSKHWDAVPILNLSLEDPSWFDICMLEALHKAGHLPTANWKSRSDYPSLLTTLVRLSYTQRCIENFPSRILMVVLRQEILKVFGKEDQDDFSYREWLVGGIRLNALDIRKLRTPNKYLAFPVLLLSKELQTAVLQLFFETTAFISNRGPAFLRKAFFWLAIPFRKRCHLEMCFRRHFTDEELLEMAKASQESSNNNLYFLDDMRGSFWRLVWLDRLSKLIAKSASVAVFVIACIYSNILFPTLAAASLIHTVADLVANPYNLLRRNYHRFSSMTEAVRGLYFIAGGLCLLGAAVHNLWLPHLATMLLLFHAAALATGLSTIAQCIPNWQDQPASTKISYLIIALTAITLCYYPTLIVGNGLPLLLNYQSIANSLTASLWFLATWSGFVITIDHIFSIKHWQHWPLPQTPVAKEVRESYRLTGIPSFYQHTLFGKALPQNAAQPTFQTTAKQPPRSAIPLRLMPA